MRKIHLISVLFLALFLSACAKPAFA
ncbi:lipoprotein [Campylobacter coli]|nr:lipoprotein [Campylobacter coli]